jgi:hypothetical protein
MTHDPEKRRRGRPRLSEPSGNSVTTWLPTRDCDRLAQLALKSGRSVSAIVRGVIVKVLPERS